MFVRPRLSLAACRPHQSALITALVLIPAFTLALSLSLLLPLDRPANFVAQFAFAQLKRDVDRGRGRGRGRGR